MATEGYFDDDDINDFVLALQIQMLQEKDDEDKSKAKKMMIVEPQKTLTDPEWDLIDPCPDIHSMFIEFDRLYFWSRLGSCRLEWSKRMTICAGLFYLREGGVIRLSEPLLKYRPRKDLVQTLLHEMIHAYLYLTRNKKDRESHGDEFKSHMNRINRLADTNITVYHNFHDEVDYQRKHVWRCNGICRTFPPFYGYVKRSMNRAPSKNDRWWAQHQATCNGTFEKISEPEKPVKQEKGDRNKLNSTSTQSQSSLSNIKKIESYFTQSSSSLSSSSASSSRSSSSSTQSISPPPKPVLVKKDPNIPTLDSFIMKKRKSDDDVTISSIKTPSFNNSNEILCIDDDDDNTKSLVKPRKLVKKESNDDDIIFISSSSSNSSLTKSDETTECPLCFKKIAFALINSHVDSHF